MRILLTSLSLLLFFSCDTFRKGTPDDDVNNAVTEAPTGLQGPAYDPSTSPVPMTAATRLPTPAAAPAPVQASAGQPVMSQTPTTAPTTDPATAPAQQEPKGPATYGQSAPVAVQQAPAPDVAQQQQDVAVMNPYGEAVPATYSAPAPGTAEAALAQLLSGKWVNGADEREIVEFTPDHYTTYYDGELLFQEAMTYHANCPGDCNGGVPMEISCFTMTGPAGTDCYGIIRLTSTVLELSLLGVSTETITYYKY